MDFLGLDGQKGPIRHFTICSIRWLCIAQNWKEETCFHLTEIHKILLVDSHSQMDLPI